MGLVWKYCGYIHRWWVLLLSFAIGGLAGLADFQRQDHLSRYTATAAVVVDDAKGLRAPVVVRVETGGERTAEDAVASAGLMISQIDSYSQTLITIRELVVVRNVDNRGWWQAALMGAAIVMLLAVGGIYVWDDVLSNQRRRPMNAQLETYSVNIPEGKAAADYIT